MWGRIDNAVVAEIVDENPEGRFHPSLRWEKLPEGAGLGWHFEDGAWSSPKSSASEINVSAVQIRIALQRFGFLERVDALVSATGGEVAARWHYATRFGRSDPAVLWAAEALRLTTADVDAIFVMAQDIE